MNKPYYNKGIAVREKIVEAIVKYTEEHNYPPTIREIGDMVGLSSTSSVHSHICKLIDEGRLETDAGVSSPRALRVPGYKLVKEEKYGQ